MFLSSLGEREMLWEHMLIGKRFQSFFKFSQTSMSVSGTYRNKDVFPFFCILGPVYKERGLPKQAGYPSTRTFPFFLCRVYKAARITRVGRLPYLRARIVPGRQVNFFPCKRSRYG